MGLVVLLAVALFAAGWLAGRGGCGRQGVPAPAASTTGSPRAEVVTSASAQVELRLDASALTLLPEGGLELPRLDPLDAGAPFEGEAGRAPSRPLTPP